MRRPPVLSVSETKPSAPKTGVTQRIRVMPRNSASTGWASEPKRQASCCESKLVPVMMTAVPPPMGPRSGSSALRLRASASTASPRAK